MAAFRSWTWALAVALTIADVLVLGQSYDQVVSDECSIPIRNFFFVNSIQSDCLSPGAMPMRVSGSTFEIDFGAAALEGDLVSLILSDKSSLADCQDSTVNLDAPSAVASGKSDSHDPDGLPRKSRDPRSVYLGPRVCLKLSFFMANVCLTFIHLDMHALRLV